MAKEENSKLAEVSKARSLRIKSIAPQVAVLSSELRTQIGRLDEDELAVLGSIKAKLNKGLADDLATRADAVGVVVW